MTVTAKTLVPAKFVDVAQTTQYTATNVTASTASAVTAVRITTVNGTDTFDAGSVNILYE